MALTLINSAKQRMKNAEVSTPKKEKPKKANLANMLKYIQNCSQQELTLLLNTANARCGIQSAVSQPAIMPYSVITSPYYAYNTTVFPTK